MSLFFTLSAEHAIQKSFEFSTDTFEGLLALDPIAQGFIPIPFRQSMEANALDPTAKEFYEDPAILLAEKQFALFCENYPTLTFPAHAIPPIIHLIWLGSPPPQTVQIAIASWRKYHPDWTILLWTDKEVAELEWTTPHSALFYNEAKNWAEKSDILRFEILYQFGGIYSDTDVICLKPFDALCNRLDFFVCFDENLIQKCATRPLVGSAIIGASKQNPILKRCLEHSQTRSEAPDVLQHIRSGPGAITRASYEVIETGQNVMIFPCSYFFPVPYRKRTTLLEEIKAMIQPESFAVHLWQASWFE